MPRYNALSVSFQMFLKMQMQAILKSHILSYVQLSGWDTQCFRNISNLVCRQSPVKNFICIFDQTVRDRTADLGRFRRRLIGKPKYEITQPATGSQKSAALLFIHFPLNSSVSTSTAFWIWLSYFTSYSVPSGLRYSYSSSISGQFRLHGYNFHSV